MFGKELFNYQDKLYWVYRKLKEHQIKPENVSLVRDYWGCDLVLRNNQNDQRILYFLVEIPEAEIVKD